MAQRRMFSPKVTSTDRFLDMPVSARELYFQLGMNADDDGFINPKMIMRMVGASEDDLKMLVIKNFVIPFRSGVIVITAWRINNLIRKDWYQETIYKEEKKMLEIKENGEYNLGNEMLTSSATIRQHRLGKDRLGKDREYKEGDVTEAPTPKDKAMEFFKDAEYLKSGETEKISTLSNKIKYISEKNKVDAAIITKEILKFSDYWTERNKSGTKQRWELEKTFEIGRRLATWFNNISKFRNIKGTDGIPKMIKI